MDQPDYKENKLSLENDLYQQITWLSIIESISSRFKDSSIIVSPEDLKNIWKHDREFLPEIFNKKNILSNWKEAINILF